MAVPEAGWVAFWRPGLAAGAAVAAALYAWRVRHPRAALFALGIGAIYAALAGPVGLAAARGLFAGRVAQDVLLTFFAAPLCLSGMPRQLCRRLLRAAAVRLPARAASRPVAAVLIFHGLLGLCLAPAAVRLLHLRGWLLAPEAALLLASAAAMWAPLLVDVPELPALGPAVQLLYLFANWLLITLAFAVLLFGSGLPYDLGQGAARPFGLSAGQDRQLGAVILGLGSHAAYLVALAAVFYRWAGREGATATPGRVYERLRGGGWSDAEARRIAGLERADGR